LDSDSEEEKGEAEGAEEAPAKAKEVAKPQEEEIKPTEWNCEICTFINPMADAACGICGQGRRPAMEALIAQIRAQKLAEARQQAPDAGAAVEEPKEEAADEDKITSENVLRLKFLAYDLTRFVKVE